MVCMHQTTRPAAGTADRALITNLTHQEGNPMSESHTTPAAPVARLDNVLAVLGTALATWATRDDSQAQPDVRESANTAMAAIDTMLAELHTARSVLVSQIRASDDATDARVDALLAIPLEERLAAREAAIRAGAR